MSSTKFSFSTLRRNYTAPHYLYDKLRTHDGIYFDSSSDCWLVTDHRAILHILGDARFFSRPTTSPMSEPSAFQVLHDAISGQMLFLDGEAHQHIQKTLQKRLSQMTKTIENDIRPIVEQTLAPSLAKGSMDLVNDLAAPVSLLTIAHFLDLPLQDPKTLQQLEQWSNTFADMTSGYFRGDVQDIIALTNYFQTFIDARRSSATASSDEWLQLGKALGYDTLTANYMMILSAGRITTKKLLGNGIPLLFQDWGQYQTNIRKNPQYLKLLTEELLRIITPTRYLARWAGEDVDLSPQFSGNHFIDQGQKVILFLEAGNYDPQSFSQPKCFDGQRRPNKHIAFGHGAHHCPGAALARLETQIVLETLFHLPNIQPRLNPDREPVWNTNPNLGGFNSCPILLY